MIYDVTTSHLMLLRQLSMYFRHIHKMEEGTRRTYDILFLVKIHLDILLCMSCWSISTYPTGCRRISSVNQLTKFWTPLPTPCTDQHQMRHARADPKCMLPWQISSRSVHCMTHRQKTRFWLHFTLLGAPVPTPFTNQGKYGMPEYTHSLCLHAKFHPDLFIVLP